MTTRTPTARTPTEIFEEVLDAWEKLRRPYLYEVETVRDEFQRALVRLVDEVSSAFPAESTASAEEAFSGPDEDPVEEEVSFQSAPPKAQVVDLMEALKASLAQDRRFRGGELAGDD
jgi:non-homologous end joining protein Ku